MVNTEYFTAGLMKDIIEFLHRGKGGEDNRLGHARIYNSFEVDAYKNMEEFKGGKVCHFFRCVITGITSEYVGKPYYGEEVMCRAEGNPYCEFIAKSVKEEEVMVIPRMKEK